MKNCFNPPHCIYLTFKSCEVDVCFTYESSPSERFTIDLSEREGVKELEDILNNYRAKFKIAVNIPYTDECDVSSLSQGLSSFITNEINSYLDLELKPKLYDTLSRSIPNICKK